MLGTIVLAVVGAGTLTWRLTRGPVDVTWLVHRAAPHWLPGVDAGRVTLELPAGPHGRELRVDAMDVQRTEAGASGQSVRRATVGLALGPLTAGRLEPLTLALDGVRAHVVAPGNGASGSAPDLQRLFSTLRQVSITDAQATVTGVAGQDLTIQDGTAELTRGADDAVLGSAALVAASGGLSSRLELDGSYGGAGGHLHGVLPAVNPAALARAVPALAAAGALDAEMALEGDASFGPGMQLIHAALHASAGPGTVQLPAKGDTTSPGRFTSLALDVEGTLVAVTLHGLRIVLTPPSTHPATTVVIAGTAERAGGRFAAHMAVNLDRLAFADLGALWPERVGGEARGWLTENITAGVGHDLHTNFTLAGALSGDDVDVTEASGSVTGDDVTLWWLRPVPPLQHAHAVVVWQEPDVLSVTVSGAKQGGIDAKAGTVRITGLTGHDQVAIIDANLAGPLGDVLGVLKHPRLQLLSKHPLPLTAPSGSVTAHLSVRLPLEGKVSIEQVAIQAAGKVADVHLGSVVAGQDLDRGQLAFNVTNDGLNIVGPAELNHVPAQLGVQMDFRAGDPRQVVQHITAALRLTKADADRAGLGAVGLAGGALEAKVDYAEQRDGVAAVQLGVDLKDAKLETPLGWSKPAGSPGHAEGRATLNHGRLVSLDHVRVEAPGLAVVVRSEIAAGRPSVVHIDRGNIGRSSATGTIVLPQRDGEAYRVTLAGPQLDLEPLLRESAAPASAPTAVRPNPPFVADLRFERVQVDAAHAIGPVALTAAGAGQHVTTAHLSAGPGRTQADLVAVPGGRRLVASTGDLGSLLRDTGVAGELEGGALQLEGMFHDNEAGAPFAGSADLSAFKVRGAPVFVGKLLQALTVYGVADALRGPGLSFDRLALPFRWQNQKLDIEDARAFSSSLGLTATGQFDLRRKLVDMRGTIVPAYFFNALPGRIPLIGRLFSPEKGSGLFAASFAVRGPVASPSVAVNPLAALTPGFTRRFFDLFK